MDSHELGEIETCTSLKRPDDANLLVGRHGTMAHKPLAPYGEGNSFPREATNTDDWLDAIGLVRSAPLPSQNPITKHACGVRLPAESLQDSSRGYELGGRREHDRKRED